MGDGEVYTEEEKVILGEVEPDLQPADQEKPPEGEAAPLEGEEKPPEGEPPPEKQPEHTDDEKAEAEKMGLKIDDKGFIVDDEGTRIPATRWRKLYYEKKEAERGRTEIETKHKLLKVLGPEKYYEIHPEEAPQGYKPAAKEKAADDPFEMVATYPDPNHPFHGKTLREIYKEDPAEGRKLERAWEQGQQTQSKNEEKVYQTYVKEAEREIETFSADISKELFGKEPSALTKEEATQVTTTIQSTLDFMNRTRRGAGILADAYFLMNKEKIVTDAKTKGGKAALESLQKPAIPSISAGSGAAGTGMSAYEAMNSDQLAKAVEGMSEKQYAAFMKNAPASLKAKHPGLPWD